MNVSEKTKAKIIREHMSKRQRKAAQTLQKRFGMDYFKSLGAKGGSKSKKKRGVEKSVA